MPVATVEGAVLDGFGDMAGVDFIEALEVGHGAGDTENAVIGTSGEAEVGDGIFHLLLRCGIELAEAADGAGSHLGIAVNTKWFETFALNLAGGQYTLANDGGGFGFFVLS